MVVVPEESAHFEFSAIPLARYAQIVGVPECNFFGVYRDDPDIHSDCPNIWTQEQRDELEQALWAAQQMMEKELTYPLSPQFFESETHEVDTRCYLLKWRHMIGAGTRLDEDVSIGFSISHASDPVTVSVPYALGTDPEEVRIYHPGTDVLIPPSAATIAGGNYIATIPRCRLVKWSLRYNPISGLLYTDTTNFESTVDIKRVSLDETDQASFRRTGCASSDCSETLASGCIRVRDSEISSVEARITSPACMYGDFLDINYQAGLTSIPFRLEEAVIRLAHSLMVATPCPCDGVRSLWARDRDIPDGAELERVASEFGFSNGAWFAWQRAQAEKIFGGSNI